MELSKSAIYCTQVCLKEYMKIKITVYILSDHNAIKQDGYILQEVHKLKETIVYYWRQIVATEKSRMKTENWLEFIKKTQTTYQNTRDTMREFILPPFLRTSIDKYKNAPCKLPRKRQPKSLPSYDISESHQQPVCHYNSMGAVLEHSPWWWLTAL